MGTPSVLVWTLSVMFGFIQDRGVFPPQMQADLSVDGNAVSAPKAGVLPYVALAGGVLTATIAYVIFWT